MSVARAANALGITLSDLFAGLEEGADLTLKPKANLPVLNTGAYVRVGRNAIRIEKLIEELHLERDLLRQTVRTLRHITPKSRTISVPEASVAGRKSGSMKADRRREERK